MIVDEGENQLSYDRNGEQTINCFHGKNLLDVQIIQMMFFKDTEKREQHL